MYDVKRDVKEVTSNVVYIYDSIKICVGNKKSCFS